MNYWRCEALRCFSMLSLLLSLRSSVINAASAFHFIGWLLGRIIMLKTLFSPGRINRLMPFLFFFAWIIIYSVLCVRGDFSDDWHTPGSVWSLLLMQTYWWTVYYSVPEQGGRVLPSPGSSITPHWPSLAPHVAISSSTLVSAIRPSESRPLITRLTVNWGDLSKISSCRLTSHCVPTLPQQACLTSAHPTAC